MLDCMKVFIAPLIELSISYYKALKATQMGNKYWSNFLTVSTRNIFEPVHEISNNVVCATSKPQTSLRIRAVCSEPLLVA